MSKKTAVKAEETRVEESVTEEQFSVVETENENQNVPVKYKVNFRYGLNLRKAPGKQNPVLKVLPNGAEVEGDGRMEDVDGVQWLAVEDGWVDNSYLTLASAEV